MDAVLLARIQFAMTVGFHFLFPPLSIGLAWILVIIEGLGLKRKDPMYTTIGQFFGKVLGLIFAVGVATGIVMEFQFGTNWSEYSKFVGDIFGAPLAAEGVFAFFLESTFLGLYIFGRSRVSKGVHWFSILMVAVGATISAFWIIVANSWQQTPAGFIVQNGRAELTDFWAAVFNPSTMVRFLHTVDAALISGAFLVAGISSYMYRKGKQQEIALRSLKFAIIFGLVVSLLEVFPFGHEHGRQVAQTQPEKFAVMQGLYTTQSGAPATVFAVPVDHPPTLKAKIEIPGVLSWLAFGDAHATIRGANEFKDEDLPPKFLTFVSYHNMVLLGMYFIFILSLGAWFIFKGKLDGSKHYMKVLTWSIPLPLAACQLGWIAAEVGRQPWIVYHLMKTRDAVSITVGAVEILISIILFALIYVLLGYTLIKLLAKKINHGFEPVPEKEA